MKNTLLAFAALGFIGLGSAKAVTIVCPCGPAVSGSVGGIALNPSAFSINEVDPFHFTVAVKAITADWRVTGEVSTSADPQDNYRLSFTNLTAVPLQFNFTLSTSWLGGPYNVAFSSESGSVIDGGDGVVNVNAGYVASLDGVVSGQILSGCGGSVRAHTPGPCGQMNLPAIPISTGADGVFSIGVSAVVSGADEYTVNGSAGMDLAPEPSARLFGLPEPSTLPLLGSALILLFALRGLLLKFRR